MNKQSFCSKDYIVKSLIKSNQNITGCKMLTNLFYLFSVFISSGTIIIWPTCVILIMYQFVSNPKRAGICHKHNIIRPLTLKPDGFMEAEARLIKSCNSVIFLFHQNLLTDSMINCFHVLKQLTKPKCPKFLEALTSEQKDICKHLLK